MELVMSVMKTLLLSISLLALVFLGACANLERDRPEVFADAPEDIFPMPDAVLEYPDAPDAPPIPDASQCPSVDPEADTCECDDDCDWNQSCHSGKCRPRCNGVENPHN